jgi:hypothetical protein
VHARKRRVEHILGGVVVVDGVFSVLSIAATIARRASESIGAEKTRTASLLQTGHGTRDPAVPTGRLTSKPSTTQRYRAWPKAQITNKTHPCSLSSDASRHFGYTGVTDNLSGTGRADDAQALA